MCCVARVEWVKPWASRWGQDSDAGPVNTPPLTSLSRTMTHRCSHWKKVITTTWFSPLYSPGWNQAWRPRFPSLWGVSRCDDQLDSDLKDRALRPWLTLYCMPYTHHSQPQHTTHFACVTPGQMFTFSLCLPNFRRQEVKREREERKKCWANEPRAIKTGWGYTYSRWNLSKTIASTIYAAAGSHESD